MSIDSSTSSDTQPDLSLLKTMVGIRNKLTAMMQKGKLPTKDAVLAVLEAERESYAAHGGFRNKEKALGLIVEKFRKGEIGMDELLIATGLDPKIVKKVASSGIKGFFSRLFGK